MNVKSFFHYLSYAQYPFILVAIGMLIIPFYEGLELIWIYLNKSLMFLGIAISLSTLQDTTKTQNEISRKVWEDPKKGKTFILIMCITALLFFVIGFFGLITTKEVFLQDIAYGLIMLGIAYISLIRAAIEMFENHRKDKKSA